MISGIFILEIKQDISKLYNKILLQFQSGAMESITAPTTGINMLKSAVQECVNPPLICQQLSRLL